MSNPEQEPGDLTDIRAAFESLRPADPGIDRDRLLYDAGRRSVHKPRGWQAATLLACVTAAVTAVSWYWSPSHVRETIVHVPTTAPHFVAREPQSDTPPAWSYPAMRESALRTAGAAVLPELDLDLRPAPVLTAGSYALPAEELGSLPGRNPE